MNTLKQQIRIMAFLVLAIALTACGGSEKKTSKESGPVQTEQPGQEIGQTAPAGEDELAGDPYEMKAFLSHEGKVERTVLVDEKGILVSLESLEYMGDMLILNFHLENNTDQTMHFVSNNTASAKNSINGCAIPSFEFMEVLEPGAKMDLPVEIYSLDLEKFNIKEISDLDFDLTVRYFDSLNDYLVKESIKLKTSIADQHDYSIESVAKAAKENQRIGEELLNTLLVEEREIRDGLKLLSIALVDRENWEDEGKEPYELILELENTSNESLQLEPGRYSLNGLSTYIWASGSSSLLLPGKKGIVSYSLIDECPTAVRKILAIDKLGTFDLELRISYPQQEKMEIETIPVHLDDQVKNYELNGVEVHQDDLLLMNYIGFAEESAFFVVKNKSKEDFMIHHLPESFTINGKSAPPSDDYFLIRPDELTLIRITYFPLEDAGISQPEEVKEIKADIEILTEEMKQIEKFSITAK